MLLFCQIHYSEYGQVCSYSIGLAESVVTRTKVWLRKKTMDLCVCESEEREHGVSAGVNATLMSDTL
jgi:hypothetical protein